jgi:CheY-like chemotaxis protein
MRTILGVITDVLFQSRLRAQGAALGYNVVMIDAYDALSDSLAAKPDCLVLDLHVTGIDWREAVAAAAESGVPVLAFGRHTEAGLLRAARAAGCDSVVPRSAFVEKLREMLGGPG